MNDVTTRQRSTPYTAYQADVKIKIEDFLELTVIPSIAGFALMTSEYADHKKSKVLLDLENDEREEVGALIMYREWGKR